MRSVFVALVAVVTVLGGVDALAEAGPLRGQVVFVGPPPAPRRIPVTVDQYVCGKDKEAEDLVLSPRQGVRSAVVWLTEPPPTARPVEAPAPPQMDQKQCSFTPRVILVPGGGTVEFLNSDRLLHNLHASPKRNPGFNRTQPKGRTIPITFAQPEFVPISCDLHSWMRGWVVVTDHPFYAVTDGEGSFSLGDLPPGRYTVNVWHEVLGTVTRTLTVTTADTPVTIQMGRR